MKKLLFLGVLIAINSCKSDTKVVETQHLFADFYVRYLETERQVKAHAAFYEGDSLPTARSIQLVKDVTFQGDPMQPRELAPSTIRYVYNGSSDYATTSFTFQYEDLSGKPRQYALQMAPITDFSVSSAATQGITLDIQTAPFQPNESLVLLFTNVKTNQAFSLEYKGVIDLPLRILPTELENLQPGKYGLYLVKKRLQPSKTEDTDFTAAIEFYSKTVEVQIGK